MTFSIDRINAARQAGYDDDTIIQAISDYDPDFGSRIQSARDAGYDSSTIMKSIEDRLSNSQQQQVPNEPEQQKEQPTENQNIEPIETSKEVEKKIRRMTRTISCLRAELAQSKEQ